MNNITTVAHGSTFKDLVQKVKVWGEKERHKNTILGFEPVINHHFQASVCDHLKTGNEVVLEVRFYTNSDSFSPVFFYPSPLLFLFCLFALHSCLLFF